MQSHDASGIFTNEDLSKPENRVNVSLFGLMTQDWFRQWFLERLGLPQDSILYPPTTKRGGELRPDLVVETTNRSKTLAWIEVELGTNLAQIQDYNKQYDEPVKSVWGRRSDGGDLSLEEILQFLDEQVGSLPPQTEVNVDHLRKLIREGLDGHSRSQQRSEVSEKMLAHPFVDQIRKRLGDKLKFTAGPTNPGELKADAIGEGGFSLRAFSHVPTGKSVFLLSIRSGSQQLKFPTKLWLEKYLPDHQAEIEAYTDLLNRMGLNIDTGKSNVYATDSLHVEKVIPHLDDLVECVLALAEPR